MADTKISALPTKATPIGADITNILDSAAANADKKITLATLPVSTATQTALDAKEDESNKAIDFTTLNNTLYPTTQAVENRIVDGVPNNVVEDGLSTGIRSGGILTINGGDNTKFDLSAGVGVIMDQTDPTDHVLQDITWGAFSAQTVTNLGTEVVTYILIDNAGAIVQQNIFPTPEERRDNIFIGRLGHANMTDLSFANSLPDFIQDSTSQMYDLLDALGSFNITGNNISSNGANLKIDRSAGKVFSRSFNYPTSEKSPHTVDIAQDILCDLYYATQTQNILTPVTDIDVLNYDVAGTITAIGGAGSESSIQRIFLAPNGIIRVHYGQTTYNNLATALAAISVDPFVPNDSVVNITTLIGYIVAQRNCTSLADTTRCRILQAGKFSTGSSGGLNNVTSLQNSYDSSTTPEIITDSTLGALSLQRGSAADTDSVLEIKNGAGTTTAFLKGNGSGQIDGSAFSTGTAAPNSTIPVVAITATNSATDVDIAMVPKGAGALVAQIPDNGTGGGNKRGSQAVDLQLLRTANTQVASGANSFAAGARNTASGNSSFSAGLNSSASATGSIAIGASIASSGSNSVALGSGGTASGSASFSVGSSNIAAGTGSIATGSNALTGSLYGRRTHSSGNIGSNGDSQGSTWDIKAQTTDATTTLLTCGGIGAGTTSRVLLPNNTAFGFEGIITGKQTGSTNCVAWTIQGLIVRGTNAASTVIVGTPTITAIDNTAGWGTPTLVADTTNGCLSVNVIGLAATTIRWTCTLKTTEITYT